MTEKAGPPLIYVVDDDEAFRDSLCWLIESAGYGVESFASAGEFLASCRPGAAVCLVLDIRMPGMSGIELQEELIRRGHTLPVVFVTGHGDVPMAVNAIKKGALDFIEKPFKDRALLALIESAARLDRAALLDSARRHSAAARVAALTRREREVMELVVAGRMNKVIAGALGISVKTVEAHRAKVMEKLGASSVAELVQIVLSSRSGPG